MTLFLPDRMSASDPAPIIPGLAHRTADSEPDLRRVAKSLLSCRTGFALGTEIADALLFGSSRLPLRATTKLSIMEWPLQLQCIGVSAVKVENRFSH
jgi:hypothetical protein